MKIPVRDLAPAQWRTGLSRTELADVVALDAAPAVIDMSALEIEVIATFQM